MEKAQYEDTIANSSLRVYQAGHASEYTDISEGLSIELGDTCNVVGGKSFVVRESTGHKLLSAWPDIYGQTGYASFAADADELSQVLDKPPRIIEEESDVREQLYLNDHDALLSEAYGFDVDVEQGAIRQKNSTYKQIHPEEHKQLYEIMAKVFNYDGPPNALLNMFNSTGGHVAGIYYEDALAGFTTIAYASDKHRGDALFVDMIGVDLDFQGKGLGRFGLQSCAVAATALGLSKVRLTFDGENKKLAQFYLSAGVQPVDYLCNIYGKGISRFLAELDLKDPRQRNRSIHGKKAATIFPGTPTVSIQPNDNVFQTHAYQLLTGPDRLVIADYDDQRGYIGYYNDTRT